ncbi:MAG: SRPBCC family protein [Owenweeksia sp.]|nr:SRPBCC family protein [Owenweeksia sp.]
MYRFSQTQHIKAPLSQVWNFYSNPANLQKLMPPTMAFEMLNPPPEKMYAGLLLRYRVAPIGGIKLPWTSKITQISEGEYFADEQVEGPFRYWHHEHRFKRWMAV